MTQTPMTNYNVSSTLQLTAANESNRLVFNASLKTNLIYNRVWKVDELLPELDTNTVWSPDGVHSTMLTDKRIANWLLSNGQNMPSGSKVDFPTISGEGYWLTNVGSRLDKNIAIPATYGIDWALAVSFIYTPSSSSVIFTNKNLTNFTKRSVSRELYIRSSRGDTTFTWPAWSWVGTNSLSGLAIGQIAKVSLQLVQTGTTPNDGDIVASCSVGTESFDTDATNYLTLNTYANSTATMRNAVNMFVKTLKNNDVWTLHDAIWPHIGTNGTQAGLNLKNTATYPITWMGLVAADFTATGAMMMGTTNYGNTTFNPTTATTPQYSQNSAHFFQYISSFGHGTNAMVVAYPGTRSGFADGTVNSTFWKIDASFSGQFTAQINEGGLSLLTDAGDDRGPMLISRTNSTSSSVYLRSINPNSTGGTSTGIPNGNFYLGTEYNSGVFGAATTKYTLAGASIGGGINLTQWAVIRQAWDDLNNALGRKAP